MDSGLSESIMHLKRKLERNTDPDFILSVICKLSKVPITLAILEATHIGKTIKSFAKLDGIVGAKAKVLLSKWREIFTRQNSDKNPNFPNESSNKESSNKHKYKHHDNLLECNPAAQPSKNNISGSCNINISTNFSDSLHQYDIKEMNSNYMDYDPHIEANVKYNPECPELFPTDNYYKTKKPILHETYKPSSMKQPLQNENKSIYKKSKSSNHSNSNLNYDDILSKKKDKNSLNKETIMKLHYEGTKKQEFSSDAKKIMCQESSENDSNKKSKIKIHSSEEFTSSEVSFEDCLGFNDIVSMKKGTKSFSSTKKQSSNDSPSKVSFNSSPRENNSNNPQKINTPEDKNVKVSKPKVSNDSEDKKIKLSHPKVSNDSSHSEQEVLKPASKLQRKGEDISYATYPELTTNYKPLPRLPDFYFPKKEVLSNEEAIKFTSSRREKTAVYSGRKNYLTGIPKLSELCTRVLSENIDAIECVGDASYDMMKPVLEKCTPTQLYNIENYNPIFIEDSNELWKAHCQRDYRLLKPIEHETWRELYWRAHDEREKKLKCITANISASMSKSTQIRQVKLAYVDAHGYVKPPRDVARKQARNGTALHLMKATVSSKQTTKQGAAKRTISTSSSSVSNSASKKPKIAPLMAKTLKSLKAFRRK